ncbi:MAG: diphthine--ammonia ligase, partial [Candidatus Woesearchaeota archaeon]
MCTIIGCFSKQCGDVFLKKGLEMLQHRGRDYFGYSTGKTIIQKKELADISFEDGPIQIGHSLHAMVSCVPQPFLDKGLFVANCELYNWKQQAKNQGIQVQNDAEFLFEQIEHIENAQDMLSVLENLTGVYAFCYIKHNIAYFARDIVGEKPLYYAKKGREFQFASEKKVLDAKSEEIFELNPRILLTYDLDTGEITEHQRPFFEKEPELTESLDEITKNVAQKLETVIAQQVPTQKIGVLFSGGIDSTILAYILQKLHVPFTCYVAGLQSDTESDDVFMAQKIAKAYGFPIEVVKLDLDETAKILPDVMDIIESSNVIKVGVALPFYICAQRARKDGVKVLFSGLGSEEIFAGYQRHAQSIDINAECVSGLRKIYERDLYRDDLITMSQTIELRLPFLDTDFVAYALRIPAKYKIQNEIKKYVLRKAAILLGLDETFALRPKKAAQYGSRFDKALQKLAKKNGFPSKSAYLHSLHKMENERLCILLSGGKDSVYAMYTMQRQNYPFSCAITLTSKNDDSFMFHTPNTHITSYQAKSLGVPLIHALTDGKKEKELDDLKAALIKAQKEYHIEGIVTGALYSTYQRERVEKIAETLGLKVFAPLWHVNQVSLLKQLLKEGFCIILTKIAAEGLDSSWLG